MARKKTKPRKKRRIVSKTVYMPKLRRHPAFTYIDVEKIRKRNYIANVHDGQIVDAFAEHQSDYTALTPITFFSLPTLTPHNDNFSLDETNNDDHMSDGSFPQLQDFYPVVQDFY